MTVAVTLSPECATTGAYAYDPYVRVWFTEDLDDPGNVTREELDYATDLTDEFCLTDIDGWEVESEIIVDPNWGVFDGQRPGTTGVEDAVLVFAADRSGLDIRTLLFRHVRGYILIQPAGDVPGFVMNVYPVWVAKTTQLQRLRNDGAQIMVRFAIVTAPFENVVIPP